MREYVSIGLVPNSPFAPIGRSKAMYPIISGRSNVSSIVIDRSDAVANLTDAPARNGFVLAVGDWSFAPVFPGAVVGVVVAATPPDTEAAAAAAAPCAAPPAPSAGLSAFSFP